MSEPDDATAPAGHAALLAEAAGKSGLVWLRPQGSQRAWPAWHVWADDAVLVLSGPGEQELPPLEGPVEVLVRSKESGGRLLTVPATARPLAPDDEAWPPAAEALAASRLNSAHSPAQLPAHWRDVGAVLTRLVLAGEPVEAPGHYEQASGAAAPVRTSATTSGWRPWHAGGRRRGGLRRLSRLRRRSDHSPG